MAHRVENREKRKKVIGAEVGEFSSVGNFIQARSKRDLAMHLMLDQVSLTCDAMYNSKHSRWVLRRQSRAE